MKKFLNINALIIAGIILLVVAVAVSNKVKELEVDHSKLPQKVAESRGFIRWITNLKNKDFVIDADEFRLKEENEIYNTKWVKVYSIDEPGRAEEFAKNITDHQNLDKVIFSPSGKQFLDFRNIQREGYAPNEVHHYGQRDNKIIDSRLVDCSVRSNCYFDRAYFLDNDVFVISEISRNIDKKDTTAPDCQPTQECSYTFKVHVVDLVNNSRLIYESKPFTIILADKIKDL